MPWKWKTDDQRLADEARNDLLKAAQIELNREVRKKLTYEYLGIWTGTLRNTTGAIRQGDKLYFGTNVSYGYAYETGDWSNVKEMNMLYKEKYQEARAKRHREALDEWRGKRKRPFLLDTIHDEGVQARILGRLKRNGNV